jgi:aryl-alcohol dehydrogenase-like predicted oxidoreductase
MKNPSSIEWGSRAAAKSGQFAFAAELSINRLGFGAMRITGKGIWGEPQDRAECIRVLRRSIDLGINFIDTADSYGPAVSEEIIAEALHPYPQGLVIATKAGFDRTGPDQWVMNGKPKHLRAACDGSLKRLRLDHIDLFQLHRIDPAVPAEDQLGTLKDLQAEGKIKHIGLSEVSVEQIRHARTIVPIVSVQNRYSVVDRAAEDVLQYCEQQNIGFIPWFPLAAGDVSKSGHQIERAAGDLKITPSQLALAWLLWRSPVMLPIPGTSRVEHLEENVAAAALQIDPGTLQNLGKMARGA